MSANRQRTRPEFFYLVALVATVGALLAPLWVANFYLLVLVFLPLLIAIVSLGLGLILARLDVQGNDGDDA